jgi:hypothetical protein|tara:strand:+ start:1099 stop:1332 length:234 start_codon:yes stop_codon:yes gene_type:complete
MKNKKEGYQLRLLYNYVFKDAMHYGNHFKIQMVAATYMAIAMRLYKTHLTKKEFDLMIETVVESKVEPYKKPKGTFH